MSDRIEHIDQTEQRETTESRSSRGSFLKRLGTTLAAAVGVAAVLATSARAAAGQCCVSDYPTCSQCSSCGSGSTAGCICFCDCTGIGKSYCWNVCRRNGCQSCPC